MSSTTLSGVVVFSAEAGAQRLKFWQSACRSSTEYRRAAEPAGNDSGSERTPSGTCVTDPPSGALIRRDVRRNPSTHGERGRRVPHSSRPGGGRTGGGSR